MFLETRKVVCGTVFLEKDHLNNTSGARERPACRSVFGIFNGCWIVAVAVLGANCAVWTVDRNFLALILSDFNGALGSLRLC
jgi:hypothetical protein